jgi:putative DNA primase/helicase
MTARHDTPDMPAVAAMLADRIDALARQLVGEQPTSWKGTKLRFRAKGSLAVVIAGSGRGTWFDHDPPAGGRPAGPKGAAGGDALDLVSHLRGCSRLAAKEWALDWLGEAPARREAATARPPVAQPAASRAPSQSSTLDLARRLWREALPADAPGSLAPIYLAGRGLMLEPGAPIRFHPDCPRGAERWPAMLALMTDPATGDPCGVHRTFLARNGSGKAPGELPAKMMAGRAGVVRLVPDTGVTMGLGIAEGVETSLSVMQGFGWRPVWAATSAGMIRTFPVLPGIEALTVFADADGAGMEAAKACAARWREAGRETCVLAPPAGDFNDLSRERAA